MTKVAPITDEELTRLERLYEEAREELHEEEESGETNSTIARCLFHDESWERFLSLLSRLRAAEAIQLGVDLTNLLHGDESYLRGMSDAREAGVVDRCTERPSVATVARIVEESGTRQLRADLAAMTKRAETAEEHIEKLVEIVEGGTPCTDVAT